MKRGGQNRLRTGFSEGNRAIPVNLGLKARIAHGFLDYVHVAAKDLGKAQFQVIQPAEVVESGLREARTKANGHVDIPSAILTAR